MDNEILTVKDLANFLRVDEKTIYRLIHDKAIPCFKVRGQWRFKKSRVEEWIDQELKESESKKK
ncbi:MAG: helix-turn-helix domain-containing protein [Candidatus Heimdallarchaeaceae archaeon]